MSHHIPTPVPAFYHGSDRIAASLSGVTIAEALPTDPARPMHPWTIHSNHPDASYTFMVANITAAGSAVTALGQAYAAGYQAAQAESSEAWNGPATATVNATTGEVTVQA